MINFFSSLLFQDFKIESLVYSCLNSKSEMFMNLNNLIKPW